MPCGVRATGATRGGIRCIAVAALDLGLLFLRCTAALRLGAWTTGPRPVRRKY